MRSKRAAMPNIHLPYDQTIKPYHHVVARLASRYLRESGSVLDVGCGLGHTLSEIRRRRPRARLTGADIDSTCLDATDRRVRLEKRILMHNIEELFTPERASRFDAVIMSHSLEHMIRPVDTVHGVHGLVKPDGVLILAVPNPVVPTVILGNFWKRNWANPGHVCVWDRAHWINFLENICKLEVAEYAQDFVAFPYSAKLHALRPLELLLARVFPWFATSNIAVIRGRAPARVDDGVAPGLETCRRDGLACEDGPPRTDASPRVSHALHEDTEEIPHGVPR